MGLLFTFHRPDAAKLNQGTPPPGAVSIADQYKVLIEQWNAAYFLSKPANVRAVMLLRERGQGGTYETEPEARLARYAASGALDPSTFDLLIDIDHAGYNAFETLSIRSQNPFGGAQSPMPDLSHPPAPAPDLETSGPQPFSEWIWQSVDGPDPAGVGSKWIPNPDDTRPVGATWPGTAKRTHSEGLYKKMQDTPWGVARHFWQRIPIPNAS